MRMRKDTLGSPPLSSVVLLSFSHFPPGFGFVVSVLGLGFFLFLLLFFSLFPIFLSGFGFVVSVLGFGFLGFFPSPL